MLIPKNALWFKIGMDYYNPKSNQHNNLISFFPLLTSLRITLPKLGINPEFYSHTTAALGSITIVLF